MQLYNQSDKHVSRLAAPAINNDRRSRSGRDGRWFGRLQNIKRVSPASPASPASPDVFSITGSMVDGCYNDFAKTFDTVPHHRQLLQLKAYNIDTDLVLWITDFLRNRKQCVVLNGEQSSWFIVISGVPGLFVPKTFHSQKRIVPMGNFRSQDFSFPGPDTTSAVCGSLKFCMKFCYNCTFNASLLC